MLKALKPTTPSSRNKIAIDYKGIGVKKLKLPRSMMGDTLKRQGRSVQSGKISVRRRGGGAKKKYRIVDFHGKESIVPGKVTDLLYDPMRNALLAYITYVDGDKRLVLATKNMKEGFNIDADQMSAREGARRELSSLPVGSQICCVELKPGKGGQLARSAGSSCFLAGFDDSGFAIIRLPSGETRKVKKNCKATLGVVGNESVFNTSAGKAGTNRNKGKRPRVLGKSMNAVDHPHGGGKGHAPIGMSMRRSKWGKPAQGVKTSTRGKRGTSKLIVKSRKKK
jgi:large subunit ribosomal protein L2